MHDSDTIFTFHLGKLVWADPPKAETPLRNAAEVKGNVVVIQRGEVPFLQKCKHAIIAGATGVIFVMDNAAFVCADDSVCISLIYFCHLHFNVTSALATHLLFSLDKHGATLRLYSHNSCHTTRRKIPRSMEKRLYSIPSTPSCSPWQIGSHNRGSPIQKSSIIRK